MKKAKSKHFLLKFQKELKIMEKLNFKWYSSMKFGSGCTMHLKKSELPKGTIIARLSKHLCCVKDGIIYDTYDCSRNGNRCV